MSHNIKITKIKTSKVTDLDFNNIPLGTIFTDHMFICDYENGQWNDPRIEPLKMIPTHQLLWLYTMGKLFLKV